MGRPAGLPIRFESQSPDARHQDDQIVGRRRRLCVRHLQDRRRPAHHLQGRAWHGPTDRIRDVARVAQLHNDLPTCEEGLSMNTTVMLTALALGAPARKETPKKEPSIVGEWAVESVNVGGNPSEPASNRWSFNADGTFDI